MQWTRKLNDAQLSTNVPLILVILIRLLFLFVGTHTHTAYTYFWVVGESSALRGRWRAPNEANKTIYHLEHPTK